MNIINLELPSLVFVVLATLFLGTVVFWRDRKSISNFLFTLLCLNFALWGIVNYFSIHPPFETTLFWVRLVLFVAAPQALLFFLFIYNFPSSKLQLPKKYLFLSILLLSSQMVLSLSSFVFSSVISIGGQEIPRAGIAMPFYGVVLVFYFILGIFYLIRRFIIATGDKKITMMIIMVGFIIMILFLLIFLFFSVVFFNNTAFIPFSPLFVLPFIVSTSYTLTRQSFLNVKLVATEFLVGSLTIALLTEALLSQSLLVILWKTLFSVLVAILGLLLIRSVHREVHRREEITHLAHSLERANIRLQELDKQKTEFLSIAAHQLRTPLSILKGYIELIMDGAYGKVSTKTLTVLKDMDISNEHLVKLVDEFLDISRIEQGRTKFTYKDYDMNQIVSDAVNELNEKATPKGMKIVWKAKEEEVKVRLDEEKIHHVIYNYIDNALKYADKGNVEIVVERDEDGVILKVKDHGVGFKKTDEVNFFQKFFRGDNVKGMNVNGTGLGLYVCRKFIEAHNGRIWAHSRGLGKGSEFGFWIPLEQK